MTAMATNVEEHTVTQSVLALQRPFDWKAMESFAEYSTWHTNRVTRGPVNLVETASGRLWHDYRVSALDDTKVHRSRAHVWGTCTFHEYSPCCPNRAPGFTHHNSDTGSYGKFRIPSKPRLLPYSFATFR